MGQEDAQKSCIYNAKASQSSLSTRYGEEHRDWSRRRRRRARHAAAFLTVPFMKRERDALHRTFSENEKGENAPLPYMGMQFVSARARIQSRTFCVSFQPGLLHRSVLLVRSAAFLSVGRRIYRSVCLHTSGVI